MFLFSVSNILRLAILSEGGAGMELILVLQEFAQMRVLAALTISSAKDLIILASILRIEKAPCERMPPIQVSPSLG